MWPGEQPLFRLAPHPDAGDKPFLRLNDDATAPSMTDPSPPSAALAPSPEEGRRLAVERWQALPGLYKFLPIGRLKPTATPLLIEIASGSPVLTETRVGVGRSFFFGANETWRWRLKAGERDQDRFWLRLVRYAAGDLYAVRSERLAVDLDRVAIDSGESTRLRVRAVPEATGAAPDIAGYRVEVVSARDGKTAQTPGLVRPSAADASRWEARVGPLPAGDYQVRVTRGRATPATAAAAPGAAAAADLSLRLHVGGGFEAELADVSADYSVLQRLAEASGGEFFAIDQLGQLRARLERACERRPRYVEQRLWDSPLLFIFVVGCLAAEWAARKRVGVA
jgi:hypothetical protein